MTSQSMEIEIKELKEQQDIIMEEIKQLKEKIENIEKGATVKLKPMIINPSNYLNFQRRQEWLERQRKQYPDEILAYIEKKDKYMLLAHSKSESDLLAQIDDLIEKNKISQNDIILFNS